VHGRPRATAGMSFRLHMRSKKSAVPLFIECSCSELKYGLRSSLLAREKAIAIEFKEQNSEHKSGPLVAIDEGMVLYNSGRVHRRKHDPIGACVREVIHWPAQGGVKQAFVAQPLGTAVFGELPIMDGEHQRSVDPDRLAHFARTCSVFRKRPMISSAFSSFDWKVGSRDVRR